MSSELPPFNTPNLTPEECILERRRLQAIERESLRKLARASIESSEERAKALGLREELKHQSQAAADELITELDPDFERAVILEFGDESVAGWAITRRPATLLSLYLTRFGELAGELSEPPRQYEVARLDLDSFDPSDLTHMQKDIESELAAIRMLKKNS